MKCPRVGGLQNKALHVGAGTPYVESQRPGGGGGGRARRVLRSAGCSESTSGMLLGDQIWCAQTGTIPALARLKPHLARWSRVCNSKGLVCAWHATTARVSVDCCAQRRGD